ncbi:MAG: DUF6093 family protein [Mycobacteriales bacterium]
MASLVSAIVAASKAYASASVDDHAAGNRVYSVRVTRPGAAPAYNRGTQVMVNPVDAVLYEGPARITNSSGGGSLDIGGEETSFTSLTVSIDAYAGLVPRVEDLVEVLESPLSVKALLSGRDFAVTSVDVGGHYAFGYTLQVTGAAPSRRT